MEKVLHVYLCDVKKVPGYAPTGIVYELENGKWVSEHSSDVMAPYRILTTEEVNTLLA